MVTKHRGKATKPSLKPCKCATTNEHTSYMLFMQLPYKPLSERVQSRIKDELGFNFELIQVRR